ncbi:MAG: COG4223 family protein [Pseudomonadota bacterium]
MTVASDPAEISPPTDPAAYARPRGRGYVAWAVGVVLILGLVGGFALARFVPGLLAKPPAPAAADIGPAEADAPVTRLPSGPAAVTPLEPPAPAAAAEFAALQQRVAALESGQTRAINAAAAALAAASLAEATQGSGPFEAELAALERLLPLSSEVRNLRPYAETGVPSRAALAAEFDAAAARAAVAARDPGERAGVLARVLHALSSIVTIRRVDPAGEGADAVLARAGQNIAAGDVEGALGALRSLPPGAVKAMAGWRARASQRAAVDRQVAEIRAQALSELMAVSRERP